MNTIAPPTRWFLFFISLLSWFHAVQCLECHWNSRMENCDRKNYETNHLMITHQGFDENKKRKKYKLMCSQIRERKIKDGFKTASGWWQWVIASDLLPKLIRRTNIQLQFLRSLFMCFIRQANGVCSVSTHCFFTIWSVDAYEPVCHGPAWVISSSMFFGVLCCVLRPVFLHSSLEFLLDNILSTRLAPSRPSALHARHIVCVERDAEPNVYQNENISNDCVFFCQFKFHVMDKSCAVYVREKQCSGLLPCANRMQEHDAVPDLILRSNFDGDNGEFTRLGCMRHCYIILSNYQR